MKTIGYLWHLLHSEKAALPLWQADPAPENGSNNQLVEFEY